MVLGCQRSRRCGFGLSVVGRSLCIMGISHLLFSSFFLCDLSVSFTLSDSVSSFKLSFSLLYIPHRFNLVPASTTTSTFYLSIYEAFHIDHNEQCDILCPLLFTIVYILQTQAFYSVSFSFCCYYAVFFVIAFVSRTRQDWTLLTNIPICSSRSATSLARSSRNYPYQSYSFSLSLLRITVISFLFVISSRHRSLLMHFLLRLLRPCYFLYYFAVSTITTSIIITNVL